MKRVICRACSGISKWTWTCSTPTRQPFCNQFVKYIKTKINIFCIKQSTMGIEEFATNDPVLLRLVSAKTPHIFFIVFCSESLQGCSDSLSPSHSLWFESSIWYQLGYFSLINLCCFGHDGILSPLDSDFVGVYSKYLFANFFAALSTKNSIWHELNSDTAFAI